jgi:hypothetical protein
MKTTILLLLLGTLLLSSCVTLYKPNAVHSPLLTEKGELSVATSMGISGSGLLNLQSAYAISDHTGIMLNGMYHHRTSSSADSSVERLNMYFGEMGVGYFSTFGKLKNGLFQCYGGGGSGYTFDKIDYPNQSDPSVHANYVNLFVQPGIAYVSDYFQISLDLRANYLYLFNIHAYLYDHFEFWNTDFKYYSGAHLDFMILEPAITIKAGSPKLKGVLQLGAIIPTVNPNSYFEVNTGSYLVFPLIKMSLGITYTFGRK